MLKHLLHLGLALMSLAVPWGALARPERTQAQALRAGRAPAARAHEDGGRQAAAQRQRRRQRVSPAGRSHPELEQARDAVAKLRQEPPRAEGRRSFARRHGATPGPPPSRPSARCRSPRVKVVRRHVGGLESRALHLTFCDGTPNPAALASLSLLARPREVARPSVPQIRAYLARPVGRGPQRQNPAYLSPGILRVHPGLALRLQKLAARFPGRTIELVSGYRPHARVTSRHHHGRAFDLRVVGVRNERVRDFLRTLDATGVGYYPNSTFVHMDVRDDRGYWVDRSGPGEPPDYGPWPPRGDKVRRTRASLVKHAVAELKDLEGSFPARTKAGPSGARRRHARVAADAVGRQGERDEPGDRMTRAEVARIRADAMRALAALAR